MRLLTGVSQPPDHDVEKASGFTGHLQDSAWSNQSILKCQLKWASWQEPGQVPDSTAQRLTEAEMCVRAITLR